MIQASELRIGNWVKTNAQIVGTNSPEFGKITQIYMDGFSVDYHYPAKWYEPIPLTPEILEKCGFIYKETGSEVYEQEWQIDGHLFIWGATSNDTYCHDFHCGGEIKYLHQLQNLYYALTGNELNYQP